MCQLAESCTIRAIPSAPFPGIRALLQKVCGFCLEVLFRHATFADMLRPDAPMIVINAPDLVKGFSDMTTRQPGMLACMNAMTDAQLHRC